MTDLFRRAPLVALALSLFAFALPGCWDRRELGNLAIVAGVGIDVAPKGQYEVSVQIIKPELVKGGQSQSGGGGGGSETAVWFGHDRGSTVFEAVRAFNKRLSRSLYLPHNQVIVIGNATARRGIRPVLDYFVRDHESRQTAWVLIAEGTARDVIEVKSQLEKIPALAISQRIESSSELCRARGAKLQEVIEKMMSKSVWPIIPMARIARQEKNVEVLVQGVAVFRQDRMVGTLDPRATRGVMWVLGEVKEAVIPITTPAKMGKATVEVIRANSKVTPSFEGEQATFGVAIHAIGNLGCEMSTADITKEPVWSSIESRAATAIRNDILSALQETQRLKADVFGLGEALHRKDPRRWKKLEKQWPEIFARAKVKITVNLILRQSGMITSTPMPKP